MTVVAAFADGDRVWMAADTRTSMGGLAYERPSKIVRVPVGDGGEALVGCCGTGAFQHLIRHDLSLPAAPDLADEDDVDAWVYRVNRALSELALDVRPALTDSAGDLEVAALLGFGGRVWLLAQNDPIPAAHGFMAVGSGEDVAFGYLTALADQDGIRPNPAAAVVGACNAACRWRCDCGAPVRLEVLG